MFHTPAQHHIGPPAGQLRNGIQHDGAQTLADVITRIQAAEAALDNRDPLRRASQMMQEHGDTFVRAIGRAIEYASPTNRDRLARTFPELVARWSRFAPPPVSHC